MAYQTLTVEIASMVATVTLNRPELRNAFNETTIDELTQAFWTLSDNMEIRTIVLAAHGPAFCAGADLNWMKKMSGYSHEENCEDAMRLASMLSAIYLCQKPVVAKVQGDCYAGGMGLVAACDVVVASDVVNFCLSEARLGLTPATISPYVIKAMGEQAARRYFVTAERFSAQEALRIGFVHVLSSKDELDAAVNTIVDTLVMNSPNAVKQAKRLVKDVAGAALNETLIAETAQRIADIRSSEQGKEGVRSFLEKRKPSWTHAL
jgi:methylglutaconyl-CoA hydratase